MTYEELQRMIKNWLLKVVYIDAEGDTYRRIDFAIAVIAVVGLLITIGIAGASELNIK